MGFNPCSEFTIERICWDPKDGELCLNRARPEETLVEARSGVDVNLTCSICASNSNPKRELVGHTAIACLQHRQIAGRS